MKIHLRKNERYTACGINLFAPVKTATAKQYLVVETFENVLDSQKCKKCSSKLNKSIK